MAASQMAPTVRGRPTGVSQSLKIQSLWLCFEYVRYENFVANMYANMCLDKPHKNENGNRDARCVQQNKRGFNVQPPGISMTAPLPIIVCKVAASNFWLDNEKLLWVPLWHIVY